MRLLLLSNSTNAGSPYLGHAADWLRAFLRPGEAGGVHRVCFVPFAGVTITFDAYATRVRERLEPLGLAMDALHEAPDPIVAVEAAEALVVGGGNTFHLVDHLHRLALLGPLARRVRAGVPFVGWSAGANVAGPTLRTTNDMPIVEPPSFATLGLVPFQINPHYTDAHPPGHQGETRADRLAEFVVANPGARVVGLPEGTALHVEGMRMERLGPHPVRLFGRHEEPREEAAVDLSFLLTE